MTEHICGPWKESGWFSRKIICVFCNKEIQTKKVVNLLSEYETLKRATERRYAHKHVIQAKDAIITLETNSDEGMSRWQELFESVLAELEGKDERAKQIR